ncbi:ArsR family transcriptional regulator [Paenibacillus hemerocallicola]|uniref:ArsR family transcriptional regulator n=1 Tax=Paenibacillus hemerocallicola TaxID=1172614 RepID=A0A5C4TAG7_9BACL|nr:ArsR family transcriptional regulator [Paenibacillus hemerocallicola]
MFFSITRVRILELLNGRPYNIGELAEALGFSSAIITKHIRKLEEAGIVSTENSVGKRGIQKRCSLRVDKLTLVLRTGTTEKSDDTARYMTELPIGQYIRYEVQPSCGLASSVNVPIRTPQMIRCRHDHGVLLRLTGSRLCFRNRCCGRNSDTADRICDIKSAIVSFLEMESSGSHFQCNFQRHDIAGMTGMVFSLLLHLKQFLQNSLIPLRAYLYVDGFSANRKVSGVIFQRKIQFVIGIANRGDDVGNGMRFWKQILYFLARIDVPVLQAACFHFVNPIAGNALSLPDVLGYLESKVRLHTMSDQALHNIVA